MALSNGLYEIRPYIAQGMCVDVGWASETPGANILIYGANGGNNQKFYLTQEETDKWSIRNINSGQYVDVYGGTAADGTNVVQWPDLDSSNQRWKLAVVGTATVGGQTCDVVTIGTWADGRGTAYNMDIDHALSSNMTNVLIWSANGQGNQKFVLVPTSAIDPRMPIPSDLKFCTEAFGENLADVVPATGRNVYMSFLCAQSWLVSEDNGFERWYRARQVFNDGTVADWGSATYGGFAPYPFAAGEGLRYWDDAGLTNWFEDNPQWKETTKAFDFEVHVRSSSEYRAQLRNVHGQEASAILRYCVVPELTISAANIAPDGLHLTVSSDYRGQQTIMHITDLMGGTSHYLTELLTFEGIGTDTDVLIPMSIVGEWIASGTELTISYRVGTELLYDMEGEHTATVESGYAEGGTLGVTPTVTMGDGRLLKVETAEPLDTVWVITDDEAFEAHMADGAAYVPYPFGRDFELIVCTRDGDQWGVLRYDARQTAPMVADGGHPCHAWSWDGGHFLLEHQLRDTLSTSRTVDAQAETYSLDTREWETLSFSPTAKGTFRATGVLVPGVSEGTIEGLLALEAAHHVTYRAPSGEIATVGVSQVSYETNVDYSQVTVTMTQETV